MPAMPQPRRVRVETSAARGGRGAHRPFQWKWVDLDRIGGLQSLVDDLIGRGWLESDGNGRVRPTNMFPIAVARAFSAIADG
jgi:hypothetical protein